jgi:two-component system, LuxR family, sensor kinase FixL
VEVQDEGLIAALATLAAESSELHGVSCHFACPHPVRIADDETATHLYRLAQEAITNALKHGRARHIRVALLATDAHLRLTIRDDGVGLPAARKGHGMGLRIMNYRAGLIGATLTIGPVPGGGTSVTCTLPRDNPHER